jgi:hypothetical protein
VTAKLAPRDEAFTDDLFAFNVALDVPEEERSAQLAEAREQVGAPDGPAGPPYADGLGIVSWSVPAERGRYDVEIKVAPTLETAVQSVKVIAVPDPAEELESVATRALAGELADLVLDDDLDTESFRRAVAVLRALGGTPVIAGVLAVDGSGVASFAVRAATRWWRLEVAGAHPVTTLALTAFGTNEHARLEHRFAR